MSLVEVQRSYNKVRWNRHILTKGIRHLPSYLKKKKNVTKEKLTPSSRLLGFSCRKQLPIFPLAHVCQGKGGIWNLVTPVVRKVWFISKDKKVSYLRLKKKKNPWEHMHFLGLVACSRAWALRSKLVVMGSQDTRWHSGTLLCASGGRQLELSCAWRLTNKSCSRARIKSCYLGTAASMVIKWKARLPLPVTLPAFPGALEKYRLIP